MIKARILILAFTVITAHADDDSTSRLKKFLTEHQKKIPFRRNFRQVKQVKELGIELPSQGNLEVKSEKEALWTVQTPAYLRVELSPEEIRIFHDPKGSPRVLKKSAMGKGESSGGDWMGLLMENPQSVVSKFNVEELRPLSFRLTPKTEHSFESVVLVFSPQNFVKEVLIQENKDDSLRINFLDK